MARLKWWVKSLMGLLLALGGWALFSFVRLLAEIALIKIGIENELLQLGIILGIVVIISLMVFGLSFKKQINKMVC